MASTQQVLLSPAELAYLHSSLSLTPPIRPDGRQPTQFRPLTAETGILPGTNGSARVCFEDGSEAIVGIKAEIEKTVNPYGSLDDPTDQKAVEREAPEEGEVPEQTGKPEWLEISIEIPGYRDDEATTVFLSSMLSEALLADGEFSKKLWINSRFHWKLYLDVRFTSLYTDLIISLNIFSRHMLNADDCYTDTSNFSAVIISLTLTFLNDAYCPASRTTTQTEIGRR
jgi:exosome complex component RRP42